MDDCAELFVRSFAITVVGWEALVNHMSRKIGHLLPTAGAEPIDGALTNMAKQWARATRTITHPCDICRSLFLSNCSMDVIEADIVISELHSPRILILGHVISKPVINLC